MILLFDRRSLIFSPQKKRNNPMISYVYILDALQPITNVFLFWKTTWKWQSYFIRFLDTLSLSQNKSKTRESEAFLLLRGGR